MRSADLLASTAFRSELAKLCQRPVDFQQPRQGASRHLHRERVFGARDYEQHHELAGERKRALALE